jgi:hypothetical protein
MYMGHLGVAVGATRISAKAPLWVLLFASALPDLADAFSGFTPWHAFITGYSHTLYGIAVLAVLMAAVGAVATRNAGVALLACALVISHLVLDFITSRMSLWPGGPLVGAGLYRHPIADFVVEVAVIVSGVYLYSRTTKIQLRRAPVIGMVACLVALQVVWDAMLLQDG